MIGLPFGEMGVYGQPQASIDASAVSVRRTGHVDVTSTADYRYRLLVDGVIDYAITMLDERGFVKSWTSGGERLMGYTTSEILGRHVSAFHTQADCRAGGPRQALEIAAREGRFECEGWNLRKDGSRFWAHRIIDPIRAPLGMLLGIPFAHGLAVVNATHPALTPWAWAINGCASVVGSILTVVISMNFGFRAVLITAAVVYLVAFRALLRGGRLRAESAVAEGVAP